jgi:hypothetical protein
MNAYLAIGTFLLGLALGALSIWIQQAPNRRVLREIDAVADRIFSKQRFAQVFICPRAPNKLDPLVRIRSRVSQASWRAMLCRGRSGYVRVAKYQVSI